jgi:hypothetical protein
MGVYFTKPGNIFTGLRAFSTSNFLMMSQFIHATFWDPGAYNGFFRDQEN